MQHKTGNLQIDVSAFHRSRLLGGKLGFSLWTEELDTLTDNLTTSWQHTITDYRHSDGRLMYKSWAQGLSTNHTSNTPKNCSLLFSGDEKEGERVREENDKHPLEILPDLLLLNKTSSCEWVKDEFLNNFYVSSEEREFPLAFSISVYSSPQQILRFLKAIYRPHNAYCIHYDDKSNIEVKRIFNNLVDCLPNIFVPTEIEKVFRGWHSVVDAQVHCFEQLLSIREQYPWEYVTTLCGKELPLRTNREMVQIFTSLNRTSAVKASVLPEWETNYIKYKWKLDPDRQSKTNEEQVFKTRVKNGPVPFNLTVYKSLAYYGLSFKFVRFLVSDEKVAILRKYLEHTRVPEEHFVPTVFRMPGKKKVHTLIYIWYQLLCALNLFSLDMALHCHNNENLYMQDATDYTIISLFVVSDIQV